MSDIAGLSMEALRSRLDENKSDLADLELEMAEGKAAFSKFAATEHDPRTYRVGRAEWDAKKVEQIRERQAILDERKEINDALKILNGYSPNAAHGFGLRTPVYKMATAIAEAERQFNAGELVEMKPMFDLLDSLNVLYKEEPLSLRTWLSMGGRWSL